jgi:histone chaperone ASF1
LDEILVGPVPVGVNKFVLQADAPDPSKLASEDLLGVTVVLVTCSYKDREFVRVGYYVNNEYHDPNAPPPPPPTVAPATGESMTGEDDEVGEDTEVLPPAPPPLPNPIPIEHIQRQILADKPRVTKFPISWGDEQPQQQQQQQQEQMSSLTMEQSLPNFNSGIVSMQEESNASFTSAPHSVQAMNE